MLGWILLSLLGLLLLVLAAPVGVELLYRDSKLRVRLRILGVRRMIYPPRPKKPRKPKKAKAKKEKPPKPPVEEAPKKPMLPMDMLQTVNDMLPEVGRLLGHTMRHFTIKRLRLQLPASADDSAEVAIRYGQMNAICYNIYIYLASATRLREWQVNIVPDWDGEHPADIALELWLRASPAVLLWGALLFAVRGGVILYRSPFISVNKNKKKKDGAQHATNTNR